MFRCGSGFLSHRSILTKKAHRYKPWDERSIDILKMSVASFHHPKSSVMEDLAERKLIGTFCTHKTCRQAAKLNRCLEYPTCGSSFDHHRPLQGNVLAKNFKEDQPNVEEIIEPISRKVKKNFKNPSIKRKKITGESDMLSYLLPNQLILRNQKEDAKLKTEVSNKLGSIEQYFHNSEAKKGHKYKPWNARNIELLKMPGAPFKSSVMEEIAERKAIGTCCAHKSCRQAGKLNPVGFSVDYHRPRQENVWQTNSKDEPGLSDTTEPISSKINKTLKNPSVIRKKMTAMSKSGTQPYLLPNRIMLKNQQEVTKSNTEAHKFGSIEQYFQNSEANYLSSSYKNLLKNKINYLSSFDQGVVNKYSPGQQKDGVSQDNSLQQSSTNRSPSDKETGPPKARLRVEAQEKGTSNPESVEKVSINRKVCANADKFSTDLLMNYPPFVSKRREEEKNVFFADCNFKKKRVIDTIGEKKDKKENHLYYRVLKKRNEALHNLITKSMEKNRDTWNWLSNKFGTIKKSAQKEKEAEDKATAQETPPTLSFQGDVQHKTFFSSKLNDLNKAIQEVKNRIESWKAFTDNDNIKPRMTAKTTPLKNVMEDANITKKEKESNIKVKSVTENISKPESPLSNGNPFNKCVEEPLKKKLASKRYFKKENEIGKEEQTVSPNLFMALTKMPSNVYKVEEIGNNKFKSNKRFSPPKKRFANTLIKKGKVLKAELNQNMRSSSMPCNLNIAEESAKYHEKPQMLLSSKSLLVSPWKAQPSLRRWVSTSAYLSINHSKKDKFMSGTFFSLASLNKSEKTKKPLKGERYIKYLAKREEIQEEPEIDTTYEISKKQKKKTNSLVRINELLTSHKVVEREEPPSKSNAWVCYEPEPVKSTVLEDEESMTTKETSNESHPSENGLLIHKLRIENQETKKNRTLKKLSSNEAKTITCLELDCKKRSCRKKEKSLINDLSSPVIMNSKGKMQSLNNIQNHGVHNKLATSGSSDLDIKNSGAPKLRSCLAFDCSKINKRDRKTTKKLDNPNDFPMHDLKLLNIKCNTKTADSMEDMSEQCQNVLEARFKKPLSKANVSTDFEEADFCRSNKVTKRKKLTSFSCRDPAISSESETPSLTVGSEEPSLTPDTKASLFHSENTRQSLSKNFSSANEVGENVEAPKRLTNITNKNKITEDLFEEKYMTDLENNAKHSHYSNEFLSKSNTNSFKQLSTKKLPKQTGGKSQEGTKHQLDSQEEGKELKNQTSEDKFHVYEARGEKYMDEKNKVLGIKNEGTLGQINSKRKGLNLSNDFSKGEDENYSLNKGDSVETKKPGLSNLGPFKSRRKNVIERNVTPSLRSDIINEQNDLDCGSSSLAGNSENENNFSPTDFEERLKNVSTDIKNSKARLKKIMDVVKNKNLKLATQDKVVSDVSHKTPKLKRNAVKNLSELANIELEGLNTKLSSGEHHDTDIKDEGKVILQSKKQIGKNSNYVIHEFNCFGPKKNTGSQCPVTPIHGNRLQSNNFHQRTRYFSLVKPTHPTAGSYSKINDDEDLKNEVLKKIKSLKEIATVQRSIEEKKIVNQEVIEGTKYVESYKKKSNNETSVSISNDMISVPKDISLSDIDDNFPGIHRDHSVTLQTSKELELFGTFNDGVKKIQGKITKISSLPEDTEKNVNPHVNKTTYHFTEKCFLNHDNKNDQKYDIVQWEKKNEVECPANLNKCWKRMISQNEEKLSPSLLSEIKNDNFDNRIQMKCSEEKKFFDMVHSRKSIREATMVTLVSPSGMKKTTFEVIEDLPVAKDKLKRIFSEAVSPNLMEGRISVTTKNNEMLQPIKQYPRSQILPLEWESNSNDDVESKLTHLKETVDGDSVKKIQQLKSKIKFEESGGLPENVSHSDQKQEFTELKETVNTDSIPEIHQLNLKIKLEESGEQKLTQLKETVESDPTPKIQQLKAKIKLEESKGLTENIDHSEPVTVKHDELPTGKKEYNLTSSERKHNLDVLKNKADLDREMVSGNEKLKNLLEAINKDHSDALDSNDRPEKAIHRMKVFLNRELPGGMYENKNIANENAKLENSENKTPMSEKINVKSENKTTESANIKNDSKNFKKEEYETVKNENITARSERLIAESKHVGTKNEQVKDHAESGKFKTGAVKQTPESVKVKPESIKAKSESIKAKSESVKAKPESIKAKSESMKAKPESVKTKPESVNAKHESVKVKRESVKAKRESVKAKRESVKAKRESVKGKPESVVNRKTEGGESNIEDTEVKIEDVQVKSAGINIKSGGVEVTPEDITVKSGGLKFKTGGIKVRPEGGKEKTEDINVKSKGVQFQSEVKLKPEVVKVKSEVVKAKAEVVKGKNEGISVKPKVVHAKSGDVKIKSEGMKTEPEGVNSTFEAVKVKSENVNVRTEDAKSKKGEISQKYRGNDEKAINENSRAKSENAKTSEGIKESVKADKVMLVKKLFFNVFNADTNFTKTSLSIPLNNSAKENIDKVLLTPHLPPEGKNSPSELKKISSDKEKLNLPQEPNKAKEKSQIKKSSDSTKVGWEQKPVAEKSDLIRKLFFSMKPLHPGVFTTENSIKEKEEVFVLKKAVPEEERSTTNLINSKGKEGIVAMKKIASANDSPRKMGTPVKRKDTIHEESINKKQKVQIENATSKPKKSATFYEMKRKPSQEMKKDTDKNIETDNNRVYQAQTYKPKSMIKLQQKKKVYMKTEAERKYEMLSQLEKKFNPDKKEKLLKEMNKDENRNTYEHRKWKMKEELVKRLSGTKDEECPGRTCRKSSWVAILPTETSSQKSSVWPDLYKGRGNHTWVKKKPLS